jgi:hypothetical protein
MFRPNRSNSVLLLVMLAATTAIARDPLKVTWKALDSAPDKYLGQSVEVIAAIDGVPKTVKPRTPLTVKNATDSAKPKNVEFIANRSQADQLLELGGSVETVRSAVITGVVLVPELPNAPYVFEIDEIRVVSPSGEIVAVIRTKTGVATVNDAGQAVSATASTPENTAAGEEMPLGTIIAAAAAVATGAFVITLLLRKRKHAKARAAAPSLPQQSVSDRLNRRVK